MALIPDLRWEDPDGVVHRVSTKTVLDRWKEERMVYRLTCGQRQFTAGHPPAFIDERITCVECLAAE